MPPITINDAGASECAWKNANRGPCYGAVAVSVNYVPICENHRPGYVDKSFHLDRRTRPWDRWDIITACNRRCVYCSRQGDYGLDPDGQSWHIDHKTPFMLSMDNSRDNLVLACQACNLRKGTRNWVGDFAPKPPLRLF